MDQNIALRYLNSRTTDSDIEEYQEINENNVVETTFTRKHSTKPVNESDFFTQYDVKSAQKGYARKKKSKQKEKSRNLMDIICSELASVAVPIVENVITVVEHTVEQSCSYLETTSRALRGFQKRPFFTDSENGWSLGSSPLHISPVFPLILENTTTEQPDIPVQYVEPAYFKDLITEYQESNDKTAKFLDVELQNIKFKHHHKFSLEKLLSEKLCDLYEEYKKVQANLNYVLKDVKVMRETRDNLKEELIKINPDEKDNLRFDTSVREYTGKLFDSKEKYFKVLQKEREAIHQIISVWCDIEMIREKTNKKETPYELEITKITLDDEEFRTQWSEVFDVEFTDILDKIEYEYVSKYIEYKEVKYAKNLDDSAKKRLSKPKLQFDEEALKEEVEIIVNNIVRKDKIDLKLKEDEAVSSRLSESAKSMLKRKYYFQIYVDDIFVCESDHVVTKNNKTFDVTFTESFSVQIFPKNQTLTIILNENDIEVASLKVILCNIKNNHVNTESIKEKFVYNNIIEPNAKHVGSGHNIKEIAAHNQIRLKSSNIFKGNLYTTCEVLIKIGWNEDLSQNQSEAIQSSMEIGGKIKRLLQGVEKPTLNALTDIIEKVYGRDVTNDESVLNTLRNVCKSDLDLDDTFSIDENSPDFVRLKLLHLRNIGGLTNLENKLIPIHASQISTEQLNCLQKSGNSDFDAQYFTDKYNEMDPIELQRFVGSKYVQKLNQNLLRNLNEHLLRKTHKDVVRDFKDLNLRSLITNSSNLTNLSSMPSATKHQLLTEALTKPQEIRVTVHRAFNLMDRSAALLDQETEEQIAGFKVRPLRPFVRVSYRGASAQTVVAIGCQPSWNQTIRIETRPAPLSVLHVAVLDEHRTDVPETEATDCVHYRSCNRWLGEVQVPLAAVMQNGEIRGTFKLSTPPVLYGYENPNRDTKPSLVPIINRLMKKDSTFISLSITSSLSHLGGLREYSQPVPTEDDYVIKQLNAFVSEYVNEFPLRNITLTFIDSCGNNACVTQFLQPLPMPDYECFPKNPKDRAESALSKSSNISKSSSSSGRKREDESYKSIESNRQSGEESIYSGVERDGNWRNGESELSKMMSACARYVSLIPTYDVTDSHVVTLLGVELLKVLHGSPLDHTILLASYFLHLGIKCYVGIGQGLPRGQSSYVLSKYDLGTRRMALQSDPPRARGLLSRHDGSVWLVYDATSGERSELRDVGCPMKTVDYVFDNENIWVNIQSSLDCENVSFDFTRTSDWRPVLDKSVSLFVRPSLSGSSRLYVPGSVRAAERLRTSLEHKLRDKLARWRPHLTTHWNRYCSGLLREMLPQWEYWSFNPSSPKPGLSPRLKQLMVSYKVFGFPLHMPYTSSKGVVSSVRATAVHDTPAPGAEFALAVDVFVYPNNVTSVWVYLATITRM